MTPAAASGTARTPDALMREAFPLHQSGDVASAEALYREILELKPDDADAHYLLGTIVHSRGELDAAVRHYRRAIAGRHGEPAFHEALGNFFLAQGDHEEACVYLGNAVALDAERPEAWNNLGLAHKTLGRLGEALQCFETALTHRPDLLPALNNGGMVLRDMARTDEALAWLRRARDLAPDNAELFSNYLFTLNLSTRHDRREITAEHFAFGAAFDRAAPPRPRAPRREGRLRIGYFSPDLRSHPVSAFVEPVLREHDRASFELFAYHLHEIEDATSERLLTLCDHWRSCDEMDDDALSAQIAADGIDILVDLAGHTSGNRLPVLARRPAPVIATWLGYLNTTGLASVDYRITDAICDPPGDEAFSRERLVRLPVTHSCFSPPPYEVIPGPLPARARAGVRFASFNKAAKLTPAMLALWARLLREAPAATLLIVGPRVEQHEALRATFVGEGIAPERIEMRGPTPLEEMLELHREVDIALDTSPYSGTTTTYNSLWMGVPVVTLPGATPVSRSCASTLTALGLADWIAGSADDYVRIAAARAADVAALARLREGLRERLRASALMDAAQFTRALEQAYRAMWAERNQDFARNATQ